MLAIDPRATSVRDRRVMESIERNVDSLRIIPAFAELPPVRLRLVAQAAEEVISTPGR